MKKLRTVRSFVKRFRNLRPNKQKIFDEMWLKYGLEISSGQISYQKTFGNNNALTLEIGFGNGETLFSLAEKYPKQNFLGIEVHKPGIGNLFELLKKQPLKNIRVYHEDVNIVLPLCIPDKTFAKILILFPDPWPKRRHHKRRLIQSQFIKLLQKKLKPSGTLNIVTDWDDYAQHISSILKKNHNFTLGNPLELSNRTIVTKFEHRGKKLGHKIYDLTYIVKNI